MAKRRNPKSKQVEAVVEVGEPMAAVETQSVAAPAAVTDGAAPVEAPAEMPNASDALPLVEPAAVAAAGLVAASAVSTADELTLQSPAATPEVTAPETAPTDLPMSESPVTTAAEASVPADKAVEPPGVANEVPAVAPTATSGTTASEAAPADLPIWESSAPPIAEAWRPTEITAETVPEIAAASTAGVATPDATIPTSEPIVAPESAAPGDGSTAAPAAPASPEPVAEASAPNPTALPAMAPIVQSARHREFLGRAASVGLAAALGVVVGSLTTSALLPGGATVNAATAQPDVPLATVASVDRLTAEVSELKAALAASTAMAPPSKNSGNVDGLSRDIAVLKASFGESEVGANQRLLELVAQVNRTEKAASELATRVAKLEKPAGGAKADVSPEITGAVKPAATPVADGWVLWRVFQGRALVENEGHIYDIMPGANLPGLGVVREITQRAGRWVVITENGMIVPAKGQRVG